MESKLREYVYQSLPVPDHIRLLQFVDIDLESSRISIALEIVKLDDETVAYTTLSYSWGRNEDGDASLCHEVIVEGERLAVTDNLHDALIRIRQHTRSTSRSGNPRFWIDALCINQKDLSERNAQVAMMADIFARGPSMIIWLGEHGEHGKTAFEALCVFLDEYDKTSMLSSEEAEATKPSLTDRLSALSKHWPQAVKALLTSRYFFRRWIVQERVSSQARLVDVLWGSHSFPITSFRLAIKKIVACFENSSEPVAPALGTRRYSQKAVNLVCRQFLLLEETFSQNGFLWSISGTPGLSKLLILLHHCSQLATTDHRDRLYALVGICRDETHVEVDYSINTTAVYAEFAEVLLTAGRIFNLIYAASVQAFFWREHDEGYRVVDGEVLPSWVPDLRYPVDFEFVGLNPGRLVPDDAYVDDCLHLRIKAAMSPMPIALERLVRARPRDPEFDHGKGDCICAFEDLDAGTASAEYAWVLRPLTQKDQYSLVGFLRIDTVEDDMSRDTSLESIFGSDPKCTWIAIC